MQRQKKGKSTAIMVLLCAVMLAALVLVRVQLAPKQDGENYRNSDAVWHTLLTVQAMRENPVSVHKFLPIVTLGEEEDKGIPWTQTLSDSAGNYFYTSFPPINFILPYLFFELTGLPVGETGLYIWSSLVSLASYIALAILLVRLLRERLPEWLILLTSFLLYFFLPEMIHSNAMVYWAQSLWQLVFLVQLNVYLSLRRNNCRRNRILFFVLAFMSCMTEWTGYIANVGFAGAAFFGLFGKSERDQTAIKRRWGFIAGTAAACVLAMTVLALRFSMAVPFTDLLATMAARMGARGVNRFKFGTFFREYWNSYYWFLPVLGSMTLLSLILPGARKRYAEVFKEHRAILLIVSFPLLENLLLMDHANQYTYDRMKAVIPLTLLFLVSVYALIPQKIKSGSGVKALVTAGLIVLSLISLNSYARYGRVGDETYRWQMQGYADNGALADYIHQNFDPDEYILGMEGPVRGWANLCFGQGIYEYSVDSILVEKALEQGKRYVIIVVVADNGNQWEKDVYPMIKVIDTVTGQIKHISIEQMDSVDPRRAK